MKYVHNQPVTCKIDEIEILDAKISINEDGTPYICQNKKDGMSAQNKLGYEYSWQLNKNFTDNNVTDLKSLTKPKDISDITTYEIGDILMDTDGYYRRVLGICGEIVVISHKGDGLIDTNFKRNGSYDSFFELQESVYKFYTPKEKTITEYTIEDIAKLLNKDVSEIKIT